MKELLCVFEILNYVFDFTFTEIDFEMVYRKIVYFVVMASFLIVACTTNPITGRRSLQIANNSELVLTAVQQYRTALSQYRVVTGTVDAKRVKNVGERIRKAAENYYTSIGRQQDLRAYQWEFNLLEDSQMNAWCMPGGKVAFYTGILPVCKNEDGIAVVMGHEISHALAGHGNERISSAMIAQYGGTLAGIAIKNDQLRNVFAQAYPIGATLTMLSYGRKQELEADEMGLYLMSMAGYDPREAQPFWHRMESMSAASGVGRKPQFLATHPNPDNRRAFLEKKMPKALHYYMATGRKI